MEPTNACCEDYERAARLSRRGFLQGLAVAGGTAVATSMFGDALRQASFAATTGGNVLVVLSLRGGIDGLGMVVPHGDPAYYRARPKIAVRADRLVAKDSFFGLHPSMAPLAWMYDSGELAAVQAVGMTTPNRSHFLAMEEVEDADPTSSVRRGWVNRMVGLGGGSDPLEAVNLGDPIMPTALVGDASALGARGLADITLKGWSDGYAARRRRQLETIWGPEENPLGQAARAALSTVESLAGIATRPYRSSNGVRYPEAFPSAGLSEALQDTAHLIRSEVGTQVVTIDYGSWDMHSNYGSDESGEMTRMVYGFASVVDAFMRDLGTLRDRVTLVTISEFGRRVAENGNRGLDHGWGNMMLAMGAGVKGGQYYGRWPGLGAGKLTDGDLSVTTDYRDVLAEVVTTRFPDRAVNSVFPGLAYRPVGLMR